MSDAELENAAFMAGLRHGVQMALCAVDIEFRKCDEGTCRNFPLLHGRLRNTITALPEVYEICNRAEEAL